MSNGSEEKGFSSGLEVYSHQLDPELNSAEESLELTPQELRRLKRIVDWRILPYISLLYLMSAFGDPVECKSSHFHVGCLISRFLGPGGFHPCFLLALLTNGNARSILDKRGWQVSRRI